MRALHKIEFGETGSTGSRARIDAICIVAFFGAVLVLAIRLEAFAHVANFSATHERWEIDEIFTTLMVMPVALGIYAWRRLRETRRELARRRAAEAAASEMALHDSLTGLPNRRKARTEVTKALESAADVPVTLLVLDLNRFKPVNDLHGHAIGDELLLMVGERLVEAAGHGAAVYRFGGDEFCILLKGLTSADAILSRVEAVSSVFDQPFELSERTVTVGASIGVTTTEHPGTTMDQLLIEADAAMYRAKSKAGNEFGFFEAGMERVALRRAEIESELRLALINGEIKAHFQPLVRLRDQRVIGYESLARWYLPDGTIRQPDDFIPIAEETGLISDVFFAVLKHSARESRNWPQGQRFAINLSPVQLNDPWLVERILKTLLEEGVSPGRLEIEVTESALVADFDVARDVLWSLKNQGVHISLDDFGTGYSSLRHLSELPFETLKIDKSFITNLNDDPAAQTIVRTVASMAHSLGLLVTAEGIETEGNAANVAAFGCDIGQGFLYGHPEASRGAGSVTSVDDADCELAAPDSRRTA